MPAQGTCTNEQKIPVSFAYTSTSGRPAPVDGGTSVTVVSGDGSYEAVDAHSGFLVSGDLPGDTVFAHEADADLGAGVVPVSDVITLSVTGAQAAAVGVVLGSPVPK